MNLNVNFIYFIPLETALETGLDFLIHHNWPTRIEENAMRKEFDAGLEIIPGESLDTMTSQIHFF